MAGMSESRVTGVLWLLKWGAIILLLTFAVHEVYALWPYPQGVSRGEAALRANLQREWSMLVAMGDERFVRLAYRVHGVLHFVLFELPGLDRLFTTAVDPRPLTGAGEMMRRFVLSCREAWQTAATGLQLFCARIAVLILALPIIGLTALGAFADGLVVWYLRRTGGGRESGFIYHRSKRLAGHAVVALAAVYLVPPVVLDPRWMFPPFLVAFGLAVRYSTAYFKKYL